LFQIQHITWKKFELKPGNAVTGQVGSSGKVYPDWEACAAGPKKMKCWAAGCVVHVNWPNFFPASVATKSIFRQWELYDE
jgi:hypothetical protein